MAGPQAFVAERACANAARLLAAGLAAFVVCGRTEPAYQVSQAYYPNGNRRQSFHYYLSANGDTVKCGPYSRWYSNGQRAEVLRYVGGRKDGPWECWDSLGRKTLEATWVGGVLHGRYWHDDILQGEVSKGCYVMGVKQGLWGEQTDTGCYVDGVREGLWYTNTRSMRRRGYYQREIGHYVHGARQGRWVRTSVRGWIANPPFIRGECSEMHYEDGRLVSEQACSDQTWDSLRASYGIVRARGYLFECPPCDTARREPSE